jgi:hypothetical protein
MILKSYNNIKQSKKPKNINIEKQFESDNYLIQTLKRTSKFQNDKKLQEYERGLYESLKNIYKSILFRNNPKLNMLYEENEEFLKSYKYLSEAFEAQTEQVLKELIIKYTQRGYKIPKFSYKNNIFKINALIEENSEKLRMMLMEELKRKENIIGPRTLSYLNKLFYLVKILVTKDQNLKVKYSKLLNKKEPFKETESIEQLKKDIENLINLTNDLKVNKIGNITFKRKSSYLTKIPQLNNFKITNSKNASKDDLIKLNSNNININNDLTNNNNNNVILSTEESSSGINIKERNPFSFSSMRLTTYGGQSNKLVSSLYSKNKLVPFENMENTNKNIKKNNFLKKAKPVINLKMKSTFYKQKSYNKRIRTANKKEKEKLKEEEDNYPNTRKTTSSDLRKYIKQAKGNKYYQSDKNNYSLGLKRNPNNFLSQKENNNAFGHSFDNTNNLKKKIERKNTVSRNENFSSEFKEIKMGNTENLEEKKSKFLMNAYMKISRGNYVNVEDFMTKYLKQIKEVNKNERSKIMEHYNYKNLRNNLFELNLRVNEDTTRKKIERIYSNIHILKRVTPALISMKDKENNIDRLEKLYTSGVNKYD